MRLTNLSCSMLLSLALFSCQEKSVKTSELTFNYKGTCNIDVESKTVDIINFFDQFGVYAMSKRKYVPEDARDSVLIFLKFNEVTQRETDLFKIYPTSSVQLELRAADTSSIMVNIDTTKKFDFIAFCQKGDHKELDQFESDLIQIVDDPRYSKYSQEDTIIRKKDMFYYLRCQYAIGDSLYHNMVDLIANKLY